MNGPHDLGGLHGFGPVQTEADEPLFHAPWERRVFALTLAMGATGSWNIDQSRAARESIGPQRYRNSSYYQIWHEGLLALMLERGQITRAELQTAAVSTPPVALKRRLQADQVEAALRRGSPTERPLAGSPAFAVGDPVRTRNLQPPTHIRLPAYVRDKPGTIASCHGAHVLADINATSGTEEPQWLYSVRFEATDLFGADTTADHVHVDCWQSYLSAA